MPEQDVHVDQTKNIYALMLTAAQKRVRRLPKLSRN